MGFGEGREKLFFRKVFPPFPNLPSHFQNNLRHADETADAARPPASAAPVLGNRRLAVRRGNRHGTFSGSGFNGLRPVCMGGQPDAPPSLLPAGGCVRHRRLVDRRKVRSPRPPRVPSIFCVSFLTVGILFFSHSARLFSPPKSSIFALGEFRPDRRRSGRKTHRILHATCTISASNPTR